MNYARARRRMWYATQKGRKNQQITLDRETRIYALKEAEWKLLLQMSFGWGEDLESS